MAPTGSIDPQSAMIKLTGDIESSIALSGECPTTLVMELSQLWVQPQLYW